MTDKPAEQVLNLLLCVISVLATPDTNIDLLLGFEKHLVVNVVKVRPGEDLHCLIFKYGLHGDYLCFRAVPRDCLRLIIDSILVESLHILVYMSEDPVQVENQQKL